jgi:hypothetical protein
MQVTGFTLLARTATPTAKTLATYRAPAIVVVIDVTAIVSTPSVVFTISGKDTTSGKTWTLLASAAIVATGTTVLQIGRALPATANLSANAAVPDSIVITPVHGNANSITYSVGVHILR